MEFKHISVLLNETIENLNIRPDGIYVDCTLGGGGHSLEICKRLSEQGRLIGIDRDQEAICAASERLKEFKDRVTIVKTPYEAYQEVLNGNGINQVDGFLMDLGVSSHQFDDAGRGFSYREDAPLDMRMDQSSGISAADVVNEYDELDLYRIIRDYGEEKFAKNIAKHIVMERSKKRIETTFELVEIIKQSIPAKIRMNGGHPAKQTFQALRIYVNRELAQLTESIPGMIDRLKPGGRICIITFHSLEDRIVKNAFKKAMNPCECPPAFPCICGKKSKGRVITSKPIIPGEEELEMNKRARSAKLRVFEKAE